MSHRHIACPSRRGAVLIVVLWLTIVLGMVALGYASGVGLGMRAAGSREARAEAYWAARGAVEYAIAVLAEEDLDLLAPDSLLFDDPLRFADQPLSDTASFSLLAPPVEGESEPRFGFGDEMAKLNINQSTEAMLMELEGMTYEMAHGLIDWRDRDSEPGAAGAEITYYMTLPDPYEPRNADFTTLEELVRVRGWREVFAAAYPDPYARFGGQPAADPLALADASRGVTGSLAPLDPVQARFILQSLTPHTSIAFTRTDGGELVNLETAEDELTDEAHMTDDEAIAVVAWRNAGNRFTNAANLLDVTRVQDQNERSQDNGERGNGASTSGSGSSGAAVFSLARVGELIDELTVGEPSGDRAVSGPVNLNTASRPVLLALPGMTEQLADSIILRRETQPFERRGEIVELNGIDAEIFKQLYPFVAVTSRQFRVIARGQSAAGVLASIEVVLSRDNEGEVTLLQWKER